VTFTLFLSLCALYSVPFTLCSSFTTFNRTTTSLTRCINRTTPTRYDEIEMLKENMRNMRLSGSFLALARELDIMEPKTPEDVYKTHLEAAGRSTANIDSARANLATTFVNAFINAGFGQDKLLLNEAATKTKWIHRNKDSGQLSAAASLGMLLMWDIDAGIQKIDAYLVSELDEVKAGALLAIGMVCASVTDDNEPAMAILPDYVTHRSMMLRASASMGLGLACVSPFLLY
jgi:26S proteasome regulatory subunit N1